MRFRYPPPLLGVLVAFCAYLGASASPLAQELPSEQPAMAETAWVFFVLDFTFEGDSLRAPRLPFYGWEVPNVSYPRGEEPQGSITVELSPFPPGQRSVELGLLPSRDTRPGALEITLGLTRSRRALYRWAANLEPLVGPVDAVILERDGALGLTQELPAEPVELVLLIGADDPDSHVAARAYFEGRAAARNGEPEPAAGWPQAPPGVAIHNLALDETIELAVPYAEGQPGQQLVLLGDGLDVIAIF